MAELITAAESETDPADTATVAAYFKEIARYGTAAQEWQDDGENIVKLYMDQEAGTRVNRRFALLWSNVQTLQPAIYAKTPIVQCGRRFNDRDPVGRTAAEILERVANTTFDLYRVDETFRLVRDDRLLPGRGQAWVRYESQIEKVAGKTEEESYEKLASEKVCVDYVHWTDFGHTVSRTWADVWAVWRRVYFSREKATKRFGKDVADKLVYSAKPPEDKDAGTGTKAVIYEIWDKTAGEVVWISKECKDILDSGPPPVKFHGFFPCPEPCYATKSSNSLIPTPDYRYYRDQAKEINDLTAKIDGRLIDL